ncbi:hypothetical protein F4561_006592 [Lipingzhangella halophila]|uniref:Uncharacterized protein n=1 Tax=Lipingzhangella halophila TaxID=1783352 RepID=A0A7W7W6C4_9ACTN|nr:hypothetical protein [Lipingzhangella halophila]MBB4935683.1 hypothetical protein [Lipingzhangella halophila]
MATPISRPQGCTCPGCCCDRHDRRQACRAAGCDPCLDLPRPRTTTTIRVQRACNGCGNDLRDANAAELDSAVAGRRLPDVTGECPTCTLARPTTTAPTTTGDPR